MERPEPPSPRDGLLGLTDQFIGPGATRNELLIQLLPLLPAAIPCYLHARNSGLDVAHAVGAALLAVDLLGGVATNSTSAAKRWYHREGQSRLHHMSFVIAHAAHITIIAWLYRDHDLRWFIVVFSYLLVAAAIIVECPRYLQRSCAHILFAVAISIDATQALFPITKGVEWFIPVFYLKLLVAHLLDETPFPPTSPQSQDVDDQEVTPLA